MNNIILKINTNSNFSLSNYTDRISSEYLYDYFDNFIKECQLMTKDGDKITAKMLIQKIDPYFSAIRLYTFSVASDELFSQMREYIESAIQKFNTNFKITDLAYDNFASDIRLWANTENLSVLNENYDLINDIASEAFTTFTNDIVKAMNVCLDENLFNENKLINLLQDYIDFNDNDALFLIDDICNDPGRLIIKNDLIIGNADITIEN